ncbi:MAG: glutathione synthase [Pseudomonadota bacterium]
MSLKVAFQMDAIVEVDPVGDSSFRLALEAAARGHRLSYYHAPDLRWDHGRILAPGWPLEVHRDRTPHFTLGPRETRDLAEEDVVWLRQDPPFDMAYITNTHLLERIHPATLVVNDPFWVRNSPEKLMVLDFADLMPRTLITRDLEALRAFRAEQGDMILKPLFGNGGAGVFHLAPGDSNLASLHEMFTQASREPLMAQEYLPAVKEGDKRVILVDGVAVGAINRVPQAGEARSNMHVGGRAEPSDLDARDREICDRLGPVLKEHGLIFVGIDVIGGKLTEINVTSPTGIQELERFSGINAAAMIWDAIEARRAAEGAPPAPVAASSSADQG